MFPSLHAPSPRHSLPPLVAILVGQHLDVGATSTTGRGGRERWGVRLLLLIMVVLCVRSLVRGVRHHFGWGWLWLWAMGLGSD